MCNCISWTILILFDVLECKYFLCCLRTQVYMLKAEGIAFRFLPDPLQIKNALQVWFLMKLFLIILLTYLNVYHFKHPHPFLSLTNKYSQIHYVTKLLFEAVMQQVHVTRFHWSAICTNLICHHGFDFSPKTSIWPRGSMLPNIVLFVTTQSF